MAGGTFVKFDKKRPGAYINFKAVKKPKSDVGTRGIATIPMPLNWGDNGIIKIESSDIPNDKLVNKIGYFGGENQIQMIREALKNCHTLLLYRLDKDGTASKGTVSGVPVVAKHYGTVGNEISIAIKKVKELYHIRTLLRGLLVHEQKVTTANEIVNNDFVEFQVGEDSTLTEVAGVTLSGGTDGTVDTASYTSYLRDIRPKMWHTMGVATEEDEVNEKIAIFINDLRESKGKKVQAVLKKFFTKNMEGIISVEQGYKTAKETVTVDSFLGYITGLCAGTNINKSNTSHVIPEAIEIINYLDDDEITEALSQGRLVLSYRQDEKVIIEQDINTLVEYSEDKDTYYSKNRIIRTLDEIHNSVRLMHEISISGKVDNEEKGRNSYKGRILSYLQDVEKMNAIKNVLAEDVVIEEGEEKDSVVATLNVQPVDAIEKIYMTVNTR